MTDFEELQHALGEAAARTLSNWAEINGRTVQTSALPWRGKGYTSARLVHIFVSEPAARTRLVVVKLLPPGQARELTAHRRALREAPETFRPRLVEQIFDPVPAPGAGLLTFQAQAGDSDAWRPMGEVQLGHLAPACETVTRAIIRDWNPETTIMKMPLAAFVRNELASAASVSRCPRPTKPGSPAADARPMWCGDWPGDAIELGRRPINIICAHVHGDLHVGNVLLEQWAGLIRHESFVLVDLLTYESRGPISRDPVRLLLSAIALVWRDLSPRQRDLLLALTTDPTGASTCELPAVAVELVRAVYATAASLLAVCGAETWRLQYLATLIPHSIVSASFQSYGPQLRQWFERLARCATDEINTQLRRFPEGARDLATLPDRHSKPRVRHVPIRRASTPGAAQVPAYHEPPYQRSPAQGEGPA